jgi:hypothetical protein
VKPSYKIRPVFDDPNLVSSAGLVPVLRLGESAGLYDLLDGLTVLSPNAAAKAVCVVDAPGPPLEVISARRPTCPGVVGRVG